MTGDLGCEDSELSPPNGDALDWLARDGRLRRAISEPWLLRSPPSHDPRFPTATEALEEDRDDAR